ncbi:MAG: phosphatase PAP2 family protein [Phycisphaerales bacterium]|nr:phosphatase PAP2 family protein [Phycisphaerales bacterium]
MALAAGAVAFAALHPFDTSVNGWLSHVRLSGDIKREWEALQQFGQGVSIVLISLTVILLDPARRARLFDLALALAAVGLTVTLMKNLIGRPRPKFNDADTFLYPWGTYPVQFKDGTTLNVHAWDWSSPSHAQLWSMPSSHTAFAVVMALFLSTLYPRIRWLVAFLALTVAAGRLVFDAHWLSDVVAGAAIAVAVGWPILKQSRGVRLLQRLKPATGR